MYWYFITISVNVKTLNIKKCKRIELTNTKYCLFQF
uniref:Uncharacterized protein n=1 Tax=Siphoviridae sp. ctMOb8 TaxID=2825460 RepID=A0A8S5PZ38_9CAUD|nr:MAG TPA: hypothetical protein [Siphoviridae sp. ctMOb8]